MGGQLQETPNSSNEAVVEVRFNQYHFSIQKLGEQEICLDVVDSKSFQRFCLNYFKFDTQVNFSTLIAALNQKEEEYLKLSVQEQINDKKEQQLRVVLKVNFTFIPPFEQVIVIPIKLGVSEQEQVQTQLRLINSEINELRTKFDLRDKQNSGKKFVVTASSGEYTQESHHIANLKLPQGKYDINISFYSSSSQNWIYFKMLDPNGADIFKLQETGFYYTNVSPGNYQPHILRCIVDANKEENTYQLMTMHCSSYKWNMKNLIISATAL